MTQQSLTRQFNVCKFNSSTQWLEARLISWESPDCKQLVLHQCQQKFVPRGSTQSSNQLPLFLMVQDDFVSWVVAFIYPSHCKELVIECYISEGIYSMVVHRFPRSKPAQAQLWPVQILAPAVDHKTWATSPLSMRTQNGLHPLDPSLPQGRAYFHRLWKTFHWRFPAMLF